MCAVGHRGTRAPCRRRAARRGRARPQRSPCRHSTPRVRNREHQLLGTDHGCRNAVPWSPLDRMVFALLRAPACNCDASRHSGLPRQNCTSTQCLHMHAQDEPAVTRLGNGWFAHARSNDRYAAAQPCDRPATGLRARPANRQRPRHHARARARRPGRRTARLATTTCRTLMFAR